MIAMLTIIRMKGHWQFDEKDDFLSCISDWNLTEHWLEMTMATIRSS